MRNIRLKPGFFRPDLSNFSSIQTLLGDFINDRNSPSLLNEFYIQKVKSLSRNSWSGRAGFLFKLGKIDKPTQISRIEKTEMKNKIAELSLSNEKIQDQNRKLQAKVDSFEATNRALLSRLEKLEKFASANIENKDLARK